ncbi:RNA-binding Raly-like protein isoform X1 [Alosa alosa]|uniref:RNA-binding Raly-like protein isoform X1 n=1 Tax=Alosa sapidissima TaxID=34773 RepID=UPI001C0812FA|nr:RNA-binding Raly-like protein isoform X1 [Alosa sapidissima]XP_048119457.1 RNA-binding Raly-like protein isoform X1 [Alosa alosa]
MTLFKSEHRSPRYMSMTGELKSSRSKTGGAKRPNSAMYGSEYDLDYDCYQEDFYDRVYDYQRVPSAMPAVPHGSSLPKRSRSSSSSTSLRRSRDRPSSKSSRPHSSSRAKLKMEELQTIKRELTLIKVQIDGLLDNLDRMDRQRQDHTGSPLSREGSLGGSPYHASASSPEASPQSPRPGRRCARRDSPELGEASDDEPHTMHHHSSDLEDEM